jgi:hypothetical protein
VSTPLPRRSLGIALGAALFAMLALALLPGRALATDDDDFTRVSAGETTLRLIPDVAKAITDAGASVAPVDPAAVTDKGIAFPITSGALDPQTLFGRVAHSGGISLSQGSVVVELRDFTIDLDEDPSLSARVGHPGVDILDLDLSGLTQSTAGNVVTLGGIEATLTAAAAKALNGAFGVTTFTDGLLLGTATVRAEV